MAVSYNTIKKCMTFADFTMQSPVVIAEVKEETKKDKKEE